VILEVRHSGLNTTRIEIVRDRNRGFEHVNGYGVSVIGEFEDFSQAPPPVREPFEAVVACLERDPSLPIQGEPAERRQFEGTRSTDSAPFELQNTALPAAVFVFFLLFWFSRKDRELLQPAVPPARFEWLGLVGLVLAALTLRFPLLVSTPPGAYELEAFISFGGLPQASGVQLMWQTPGLSLLLTPWHALGEALGVGGELWWLRLPNLALVAWVLVNIVRMGRLLGARQAGWGAALLFALAPHAVLSSVFQGHYFLEVAVSIWFIERLTTYVVERRSVYAGLAVSAALAMWAGHLCFFVVAPGFLIFLVVAWRRGRGKFALSTVLLFELLYLPILVSAIASALAYMAFSVSEVPGHYESMEIELRFGHNPLEVTYGAKSILTFPYEFAHRLFGNSLAWMSLFGVCALWLRKWRYATYPTVVVILLGVMRTQAAARWVNFHVLIPFAFFLPLWGFSQLKGTKRKLLMGGFFIAALALPIAADLEPRDLNIEQENVPWPIWHDSVGSFEELLRENESTPLLMVDLAANSLFLFCPERNSADAILACLAAARPVEVRHGYQVLDLYGRPIYLMRGAAAWEERHCAEVAERLGSEPFFMLGTSEGPLVEIPEACNSHFDEAHCQVERSTVGLALQACEL